MAAEYGDDLQIIFVESQGHSSEEAEAFAWDHKWMGTSAMWTTEAPFRTGSKGIPNFALLSNEGEVLLMGNPLSMGKQIEEAIDAEIKKANAIPEDTPKSLKKAWKAFVKGDYGKAVAEARKVEAKGGADGEEATAAIDVFIERVEDELGRANWMIENGYLVEAQKFMKDLSKRTKGIAEVAEESTEIGAKLDSDDLKAELTAAQALSKLIDKLAEGGYDDKLIKKLEKFVKKNEATKAAKRAQHLVDISSKV